jgi:GxxExxY protein
MTNCVALVGHQERKVRWDTGDAWDQSDWTCRGRDDSMISIRAQRELSGMVRGELIHERLTHSVIGAFFEVYNTLGFGFLEHVYVMALERELMARGHSVGREVHVPVTYKGELLVRQRLDMVVDELLVVEVKSTYELHRAATRQVFNYLRATKLDLGLLFHLGPEPKVYRVSRRRPSSSSSDRVYREYPTHPKHPNEPSVLDASPTGSEQA